MMAMVVDSEGTIGSQCWRLDIAGRDAMQYIYAWHPAQVL